MILLLAILSAAFLMGLEFGVLVERWHQTRSLSKAVDSLADDSTSSLVVRSCACGRRYTLEQWQELFLCGELAAGPKTLELRNCECGSTLSVNLNALKENSHGRQA